MQIGLYNDNFIKQNYSGNNLPAKSNNINKSVYLNDMFVKKQNISFKENDFDPPVNNVSNKSMSDNMIYAVKEGQTNTVKRLLEKGVNVDLKDKDGDTLLISAIRRGHLDVAKVLIDSGADLEYHEKRNSWTPLIIAASWGYIDIVNKLIEHKADLNSQGQNGDTAMYVACETKYDVIKLLLENGADPNISTKLGSTALMTAAFYNKPKTVKLLLDYGANPDSREYRGQTALMRATELYGNPDILRLLLEYGADPDIKDNEGKTALDYAKKNKKSGCVKLLQTYNGVEKTKSDLTGRLIKIVESNPYDFDISKVSKQLNNPDAKEITNIKFKELTNSTLLHLLASRKIDSQKQRDEQLNLISYLLKLGADVNAKNGIGNTPLTIAAMRGDDILVSFLLKKGANPGIENNYGCKPIFYAQKENYKNIATILQVFEYL